MINFLLKKKKTGKFKSISRLIKRYIYLAWKEEVIIKARYSNLYLLSFFFWEISLYLIWNFVKKMSCHFFLGIDDIDAIYFLDLTTTTKKFEIIY